MYKLMFQLSSRCRRNKQAKRAHSLYYYNKTIGLKYMLIIIITVLTKAKGKNLLYFGCRNKAKDFLYKDELGRFIGCRV